MKFLPLLVVIMQVAQAPSGMVLIPEGEFWMGRTHTGSIEQAVILERDRRDDTPAHRIHIDAFYMDQFEVTNEEYARFAEATGAAKPWHWPGGKVAKGEERFPIHDVTWADADAYCRSVGKRLPSEAEWERAARGGLDRKRYPWGDEGARGKAHTGTPTGPVSVGSFPPNPYGVHDIAGNVWEWTNDWYDRDYYSISPESNPPGAATGHYKVIRGGGFTDGAVLNSFRNYADPEMRTSIIGFRCAKSIN
jgi:formylglycine-generating enzyme required for sulfatase activity